MTSQDASTLSKSIAVRVPRELKARFIETADRKGINQTKWFRNRLDTLLGLSSVPDDLSDPDVDNFEFDDMLVFRAPSELVDAFKKVAGRKVSAWIRKVIAEFSRT